MTNSHAETADLTCRGCGRQFAAEVWVIIDVDERPDLLARVRAGTLHTLTCPHCGQTAMLNAPLLLLRPAGDPALIFSPGRGGGRDEAEQQAVALVGMLRQHLGAAWRDAWLGEGVIGVTREALPDVLSDDPTTAGRLAAAAAATDDVPPSVRDALEQVLRALAGEGVRVQSAEDLRRALEARPALAARLAAALREQE